MPSTGDLRDLLRRARDGDAEAAAAVVRRYETAVRVAVRVRITDPGLRRHFDSLDVCQSVLASFFVRLAAGQFDVAGPRELLRLLVLMAKRKLATRARYHRRQRRDLKRLVGDSSQRIVPALADLSTAPDRAAAGRELLARLDAFLSPEERALVEARQAGEGWRQIAERLGGTGQARRKQLARALDRFTEAVGLDRDDDLLA